MKKNIFLIGLLIMESTVFAQKFSINGHLATNFENVHPTFGLEVNLNKVDILAGVSFWVYKDDDIVLLLDK